MTQATKTLIAFATRWGPEFGGINSFNADLLPAVAAAFDGAVKTVCVVLHAGSAEIEDALSKNVQLVSLGTPGTKEFNALPETEVLQKINEAGLQPYTSETVWLGHDRITGEIALASAKKFGGRSALIHHMSYRHYEAFAESGAHAVSKKSSQKKIFEKADVLLAIGPLLKDALSDMLDDKSVHMLVPGLPVIAHKTVPRNFNAFLSGRLDDSARKIKQAYLGVAAFGDAIYQCTVDTRLPSAFHRDNEPWLMLRGIDFEKSDGAIDSQAEADLNKFAEEYAKGVLTLHALPFTKNREELFNDLRAASVAMMPSWHEGFGLVAWEAIAAGVPLIVSKKSGAYRLLEEFQNGIYTSLVCGISIAGSNTHPYFQPNDLKCLSDALIEIAKDPTKFRRKAAELHRGLLTHFNWSNCAKQLTEAFGWNFGDGPDTIVSPSTAPTPPTLPTADLFLGMSLAEIRSSFESTSAIGRYWNQDILGERISTPVLKTVLTAIDNKTRSILLTGLPGSGKTCVMLEVQAALELRAKASTGLVPLFIQSREFADQVSAQDRQAQGLNPQWVEQVALVAREAHVVVVIDSLDVLSIAREHSVLTYFLAQIDRLLSIQNVTVVTACRDFDRHYDRRIAVRKWDVELKCQALNWETEVSPLLDKLGIDTTTTDEVTRELIRNPRELALFVELSKSGASVNAVTSHALSQHYLRTVVQENGALGDVAMQAIEAIAKEMLTVRSLTVPAQCFSASQEILQALLSQNVLHRTQDGKLAFGHQTLLDVLVVSGASRRRETLNSFIQGLPPVPFVRPSIRSFVAQVAIGERDEFRKQLRTVLTGTAPFQIRRLVAESFAEQKPEDGDWALINDLRKAHREIFQIVYTHAAAIAWHHFWFKHLVPALKNERDEEGLATHVHRVQQWKNEDSENILTFWTEALALDWVTGERIAERLGLYLSEIEVENVAILIPLLEKLLSLPRQPHSFLGRAIARAIKDGGANDTMLWRYITGNVSSDDDARSFQFGNRLACQPHEFEDRDENFLQQRMLQSTELLDLAIGSIEHWSHARLSQYSSAGAHYWAGFLKETSHNDTHSQTDHRHIDALRLLLDAIEAAILRHATAHSQWWIQNRERLALSSEGALRYFAITACTASPGTNIDSIEKLLCDKKLLESELSYELGTLIRASFVYLQPSAQDAVLKTIMQINEEHFDDELSRPWVLRARAQLLMTVPCYLRSLAAQALLDMQEKTEGYIIRKPQITMRGGMVSAPFSFEVFSNASDSGVLHLLEHYTGYSNIRGDDFLIGGEREVGWQLREAASRQPGRFVRLLPTYWAQISVSFRNDIMDGVANYLSHRYGQLQASGTWVPLEEPDASRLAQQIIDELERHPNHWHHNPSASSALQACAHVTTESRDTARLVFLSIGFENLREESSISGDSVDLLTTGINMARGNIVETLMILANRLLEKGLEFPELLQPTLRRFADDDNPAIRALFLRRLPFLQSKNPELGWDLFDYAIQTSQGLWSSAETCLYYAYHDNFSRVAPYLQRIRNEGTGKDWEVWGRISALASLIERVNFSIFLEELKVLDATEAWQGAASVWTHPENIHKHNDQCIAGIEAGLNARNAHASVVAGQMDQIFRDKAIAISVPTALIRRYFYVLEEDTENKHHRLFGLDVWLNTKAQHDANQALDVAEIYLGYSKRTRSYLYDYENNLTQLLTRLFANAEESEEHDKGVMLRRVVALQDKLLELGVDGVEKWLKASERP